MHRSRDKDVVGSRSVPILRPFMPLAESLERVRFAMVSEFQAETLFDPVRSLMDHVLKAQGKMIRPGLVLAAGRCLGGLCDQHIEAAATMEMIHQATLLHDDVLDCAEFRRGNPSTNHLWGNSAAILLGDLVLSRVLRRCADLRPEVARVVADMACCVCRGELRQTLHRAHWHMTEDEYLEIIADKSASFFGACCRVGALLADATPEQGDALAEYGLNVGMAFQMADDVLDLVADSEQTGKSSGRDVGMGTPTLPVIHLLCTMDPFGREDLLDRIGREEDVSDRLRDLLIRHRSLDYVRSRCKSYVGQATQSLDRVGSLDDKALQGLADYCLARVG
jgi:octaprenyl-diphosphate synthase